MENDCRLFRSLTIDKMSASERTLFDRWIAANIVLSSLIAIGLVASAFMGYQSREVASNKTRFEAAAQPPLTKKLVAPDKD